MRARLSGLRPECGAVHGAGLGLGHARWGCGRVTSAAVVARQWPHRGNWGRRRRWVREKRASVACAGATPAGLGRRGRRGLSPSRVKGRVGEAEQDWREGLQNVAGGRPRTPWRTGGQSPALHARSSAVDVLLATGQSHGSPAQPCVTGVGRASKH